MERFIDFQPSVEADSPTGELSAGERHQARVQQINEAQAKAFGLPPVPAEGVDPFGALRNWLKRETGQFSGDRHHGQPGDPGYVAPEDAS